MSKAVGRAAQKRVRLQPEIRKDQILDAALVEFGTHGFTATTVERIATRARLSKAGVYAHFSSKDEIFETLLTKMLKPSFPAQYWRPAPGQPPEAAIDAYIDQAYAKFEEPHVEAVLRLVIAESRRMPHLVQRWRTEVLQPYLDEQQQMISRCVAEGLIRPSPITEYFNIALAPVVQGWLMYLIFGEDYARRDLNKLKEAHRRLLRETLKTGL